MKTLERVAWKSVSQMVNNFSWNTKAENHAILVCSMIEGSQKLGCLMSIKMYLLFSQMKKFPKTHGVISEEQEERLHQGVHHVRERYQRWWDPVMIADYCWSLKTDNPAAAHTRESNKQRFIL